MATEKLQTIDRKFDAFKLYDSDYGPFILNQYNRYQPDALLATKNAIIFSCCLSLIRS